MSAIDVIFDFTLYSCDLSENKVPNVPQADAPLGVSACSFGKGDRRDFSLIGENLCFGQEKLAFPTLIWGKVWGQTVLPIV